MKIDKNNKISFVNRIFTIINDNFVGKCYSLREESPEDFDKIKSDAIIDVIIERSISIIVEIIDFSNVLDKSDSYYIVNSVIITFEQLSKAFYEPNCDTKEAITANTDFVLKKSLKVINDSYNIFKD